MPMLAAIGSAVAGWVGTVGLATAVTYVGTGLTVVGAVTGNKKMMKIGGIMGIAGGVMNLAGIGSAAASGAAESSLTEVMKETGQDAVEGATSGIWDDVANEATADSVTDWAMNAGTEGAVTSAVADPSAVTGAIEDVAQNAGGVLNAAAQPAPLANAVADATTNVSSALDPTDFIGKSTSAAPSLTQSVTGASQPTAGVSGTGQVAAGGGDDKKTFWKSLPESTKNEIIKAGLAGAGQFFAGWSASEKAEWEQDRAREMQTNLNAQPTIARYQKPAGLLNAKPQPVGA